MAAPTITLRVPESTGAALASLSEATGRPVGDLIREGIDLLLADVDEEKLQRDVNEAQRQRDVAMGNVIAAAKAARARRSNPEKPAD